MATANTKPTATPMHRPKAASCKVMSRFSHRDGASVTKAVTTCTGEGSM